MMSNIRGVFGSRIFQVLVAALAGATAFGALVNEAAAEVKLPAIFSDNCVLQRDTGGVAVWGWADPGEEVTVSVAGKSAKATPDREGKWLAKLPALPAGGPFDMTVRGKNTLKVNNVLVGEVWLCSGQSNMEMPIDWGAWGKFGSPEFEAQLKAANDPQLRMFVVNEQISGAPAKDVTGAWKVCKPDMSMMKWSALGYFFGRDLRQNLKTPVGVIDDAVGGTPVESWLSRDALLSAEPDKKQTLRWWDATVKKNAPAEEAWNAAAEKAKAAGEKPAAKPKNLDISPDNPWWPASLYRGMIQPIEPYTVRGIAWYQGESNAGNPEYARIFPALIENWRKDWGNENLPFLFVQLANYQADEAAKADQQTQPSENSRWAVIREAQRRTLSVPNTGMAVIIDIGEARNIHPKNKEEAGRRVALLAEHLVYGQSVVDSGPLLQSFKVKGKDVILQFKDVGGGLIARGGGELKGFAIAGADRKFVWASTRIEGKTVVVSSADVPNPVAVRYDWADNPIGNLVNKENLPASPFATDDWAFETPPASAKK
jgi:sialate O-acetylesterase